MNSHGTMGVFKKVMTKLVNGSKTQAQQRKQRKQNKGMLSHKCRAIMNSGPGIAKARET